MADFYDMVFYEPPTREQEILESFEIYMRRFNPAYIPNKVSEDFNISIEEAQRMFKFWRKLTNR